MLSSNTTKSQIQDRLKAGSASKVWTPADFIDLGTRDVVDKTLQRLTKVGNLQRIDRGLYMTPHINTLTKKTATPDYQKIIEAVSRREQVRVLVDGLTAANALGLTDAVPGKVIAHIDARLRPIQIGNLLIQFKLTAPSKLYWADRPAMYLVQALYWLHDNLKNLDNAKQNHVEKKITRLLSSTKGKEICHDLVEGFHMLPIWMQNWLRNKIPTIEKNSHEL